MTMSARFLASICFVFLTLLPAHLAAQARPITPQQAEGMRITAVKTLGVEIAAPGRIETLLGLQRGERFEPRRIEEARRRLLAAGWLQKLDVVPAVASPESLVVVVIAEPTRRTRVTPIVQMRADERLVYGGKLQVWGKAGRGERLSLAVAGGGEKLLQLEWSEPRPFLSLPLSGFVHAGVSQEREAAEESIRFDRDVAGIGLALPDHGLRLELAGSLWRVRGDQAMAVLSPDGSDRLRRGSVAVAIGQRPRGFAWSYLHASAGVRATAGDAEHQDLDLELQGATHLGKRFIVATGFHWRSVRGTVPRYGRMHLGGGPSLRGHDYGVANGDAASWGGVEVRVPVNFWSPPSFARVPFPLALHFFADAGSAWGASAPGAESEATRLEDATLHWSAGAGITGFLRRAYPMLLELGRDDGGTWRLGFRTRLAF
jgi:hypothetical protein